MRATRCDAACARRGSRVPPPATQLTITSARCACPARLLSTQSCWLVVHGKVYDVTEFLEVRAQTRWRLSGCCRHAALRCAQLTPLHALPRVPHMQEHPGGYDIIVTSAGGQPAWWRACAFVCKLTWAPGWCAASEGVLLRTSAQPEVQLALGIARCSWARAAGTTQPWWCMRHAGDSDSSQAAAAVTSLRSA
jgi:hypothetical protein